MVPHGSICFLDGSQDQLGIPRHPSDDFYVARVPKRDKTSRFLTPTLIGISSSFTSANWTITMPTCARKRATSRFRKRSEKSNSFSLSFPTHKWDPLHLLSYLHVSIHSTLVLVKIIFSQSSNIRFDQAFLSFASCRVFLVSFVRCSYRLCSEQSACVGKTRDLVLIGAHGG
jgi:hypothetical protein